MDSTNNLRKRLYQNLHSKQPKQNHLLSSDPHSKSAILKPKIALQSMNTTAKIMSPVFNRGKIMLQNKAKSPEVPKKITPIPVKDKISKQGKAIIEQGKLKSKANLKPHDIFAFYQAFPEMSEDFFYLNRVSHPYDYQIVTYSQRNQMEYMTISFKGVTLYHEKEAQFLTKQQWLADEKNFYSLQKIEFFKQYKISKNFTIWKNRMRRHYMKEMSNMLHESLFFSYQHPRQCLLQIRKQTNILKQETYFMPTNTIDSLQPNEFKKNSQEYIEEHFVKKLKQVEDLIAEHLQVAITQQIRKFKLENNIKITDVGDYDQKQQKQGYVYSQEAILRKQYKKVNRLIKLADNMLAQSKMELLHDCLLQLIDRIQEVNSSDSKSQWIKCTAQLFQSQTSNNQIKKIQWSPTLQGLQNIFKDIINLAVTKMSDLHQKIGSRQKFQKYKSGDENQNRKDEKRNTLKYIIQESSFYSDLIDRINEYLQQEFKKTEIHEKQLSKYIDIFTKHKSLPQIKEIFKLHSAGEYMQLVRQWREDDTEMHSLPMNKSGGLLIFDYSLLRSVIHDVPKKTLTSFLSQLPQQTKKKYNNLVDESQIHLQQINNYPINMEEFVQFNQAVKKATSALEDLIDGSKALIQMVALIDENKTPSSDFNKINPKKAIQNINKLKAKVDESNAKYDQSLSKFKKQLESRISKVKNSIKDLASKFETIPFDSISSQIAPTLQKIQQVFPSIQKLQQEALAIQQIQFQLSLPSSQLDQIHNLYKKLIDVKNLWQCKQKWNDLLLQIFHKHYKQIDCKQLKMRWEQFSKKNNDLLKSLSDNQVLKKLIGEISQFQNLLEIIVALTSPNLQQKSWRQISEYLAYELNIQDQKSLPFSNKDNPQYTVQWLINNNISLYKEKISFIVQKSQKQKQLQASLNEFKMFISTIVFDTVTKKREVVLIEKNQNLHQNIQQKISTLYSLIRNQYSDSLKNQAEVMIKHFEYLEEIIEGIYNFRDQWQKYEPFFESNTVSAKLLTKEAKQFSSWQLQWKKIIKNITNDPTFFYRKICDQTMGVNCSRAILKSMVKANMLLDLVKKGMQEFLQKKRTQFPRYCLFSDEELISILSKLDNRHFIVPEIITILYDNIKSIEYDQQSGAIISVTTHQQQKFPLLRQTAFKMQSQMEDLLKISEEQIKKTMAHTIRSVFGKYIEEEISRESLLTDNLIQIALQVDFIAWVRLAQQTYLINEPVGNMQDWLSIQEQQIKEVSQLLRKSSPKDYFKYTQFMVQSIYFRQKTKSLKQNNIVDTNFYQWQRIPKMIMSNTDLHLRQLDSKIPYNNELLNQKQIVFIQSETEKAWINLANAISNKDGKNFISLSGNHIQTVKDLAFYVGQSFKSIHFSESCNVKTVQKLLTGCMIIGYWMHFAPILNSQILSYFAYHINANKRSSNFESVSSALQLNKSTALNNSFSNAVFFFESGQNFIEKNLIDPKNFRNVTLHKPSEKMLITVICEAQQIPKEIGTILLNVCEFFRKSFDFSTFMTEQFLMSTLQQIKQSYLVKFTPNEMKEQEILHFIVFYVIDEKVSTYFSVLDQELYQIFKTSYLPNYHIFKAKFSHRFKSGNTDQPHPVQNYLNFLKIYNYNKQFIGQAIKAYDMLRNDKKFGVILSGQILSGKSQMISFLQSVMRHQMQQREKQFKVFKLYPNAYKSEDILKSYNQQKKQKSEKNSEDDFGILQHFLLNQTPKKWFVIDGQIQKPIIQFLCKKFDETLIPNYGLISKQKNLKENLESVNIILETLKTNNFQPSVFYNYSLCHVSSAAINVQCLVKSFFQKHKTKKYLKNLSEESISYIEQQLIINLTKVQQKGNIKTKSLEFLYPFSENEITFKCLKIIECIFKMNQESIRQKEKNMKKTIQKFVLWSILMILFLHVEVESQNKLQKKFMEVCKCENTFHESVNQHIVYPGSGIEVHLINGLRTQSSLFEIPEKGIVTSITKTDFNEYNNFMSQKTNKFYEQISLETVSMIRINNEESNLFNYYAQLFAYSNIPLILTGPVGTGKKSIFQLYAKNIRHRSFVHSIRHHPNRSFCNEFQKYFRRYNSFDGVVLKSPSVTKDVLILVEDLNLIEKQKESLQFFRMLLNQNGFINKNGNLKKLTEDNNCISILSNCIDSQQSTIRVCSRLMFFQTSNNSLQKLTSIYAPFMKAWSKANNLQGQVQRIFTSTNGDTLLDATLKIFEFMEETYKFKKSQGDYSLDSLLLRPRIGDISKVLSCICLTQDANKMTLGYFSDLWANQIMRVFEDRLSPSQQDIIKSLMDLVKKEYFLKFKQNFQYNPKQLFIFSSYLSRQNRLYERMYDLESLQQMIENAYESQTITVPIKLFFAEILKQILKVYRIFEITSGHMILFHLNKKVRHYLIQLASQVAQAPMYQMKKNVLTPQRDIISILQYEGNVSVFQDLDDITEQQIYQFTCLANNNSYDFDMKPQIREKIKTKVTKYLRQLLSQISVSKESSSQNQKLKNDFNNKDKENLYISQKLEDELESTMQEILMNSVHFLFGASPTNPKTRRFLFNEIDLVGEMQFSFFDIPHQSLVQISKQVLTTEEHEEIQNQTENIAKKDPKSVEKQSEIIMEKCIKIYNSLSPSEKNYNSLLTVCQNIMTDKVKLKQQIQSHIEQLQKCIQNHKKALQLITQNQSKLQKSIIQLEDIKNQQVALSEKLQLKNNQINEIQLNLNENEETNHENSEKKLLLQQKNKELEQIQDCLREIKAKKDKNDVETREARKMIQLSKDYMEIIQEISSVQKKLQQQKQLHANIQNILTIWWSLINYSSNKDTLEMIAQLNEWMQIVELNPKTPIENCEDILKLFELVIGPLYMAIPALGSINSENKLKVLILMFIIFRHDETTCENRIVNLYDPCKVYASIFKFLPIDSELGNFTLAHTINKYDDNFWMEIQKHKRGIIFLGSSIDSRQKRQIQSHIIKRRLFPLNRFVSLVEDREKADVSFIFQKDYFVNHLKLLSLYTDDASSALQLLQTRDDFMKQTKKLKEMNKNLRNKIANIKFEMETDTEELSRHQRDITSLQAKVTQHSIKVSLQNLKVTEEKIICKIIDQLYQNLDIGSKQFKQESYKIFNLPTIQKLYKIIRDVILRFVSDLRQKSQQEQKKQVKAVQISKNQRRSVRPSMNSMQIPSQLIQQASRSQFTFTRQEQQKVDEMVEKLIRENFGKSKSLSCSDMFNMNLLCFQILSKVPIIIVQNNLPNQGIINRENRPINLLYNSFSNVISQSLGSNSNEEKGVINYKVFLFYNDDSHYNSLVQLVNKYHEDFNSFEKKQCIYLFSNLKSPLLAEGQKRQDSKYKIFYLKNDQKDQEKPKKSNNHRKLSQKSTTTEIFIRIIQLISDEKLFNQTEIERYAQFLTSKVFTNQEQTHPQRKNNELKKYLTDVSLGLQNQQALLQKITKNLITFEDVNSLIEKIQNSKPVKKQQNRQVFNQIDSKQKSFSKFECSSEFTKEKFQFINEELPNVFNFSEFLVPASKDVLAFQFENLAKSFNLKMRKVKNILQNNLKASTFSLNKFADTYLEKGLYLLPTAQYILNLNKEYRIIKKLLIQNGILPGSSSSMSKIVSTKGLGTNAFSDSSKNAMFLSSHYFNLKVLSQFKVRACKKLKIPYSRVGLLFLLEKKSQGSFYSSSIQKLISTTASDLILSTNVELINFELKNPVHRANEQKDSSKYFTRSQKDQTKMIRLLIVPYDKNAFSDTNWFNFGVSAEVFNISMKKKNTIFGQTTLKKQQATKDKSPIQTLKIKVILSSSQIQESKKQNNSQQIAIIQIPSNEVVIENQGVVIPLVLINNKKIH